MTEEEAIAKSTRWVEQDGCIGYLPFDAANFLVATGNWQFQQVTFWGYVLRRKGAG